MSNPYHNYAPALRAGLYVMLSINCAVVLAQTGRRLAKYKRINAGDAIMILALASSIGQFIGAILEAYRGYGTPITLTLDESTKLSAEKANTIGNILYVSTVCITQMWLITFLWPVSPRKLDRGLLWGTAIFIMAWSLGSFFSAVFKCPLPYPWDNSHGGCIDKGAFWTSYDTLIIISDVWLVILPFIIVLRNKTALGKQLTACSYLSIRLLVIAPCVAHLVFLNSKGAIAHLDDWKVVLSRSIVVSVSLLVSCLSQFQWIQDSLVSGKSAVGGTYDHTSVDSATESQRNQSVDQDELEKEP